MTMLYQQRPVRDLIGPSVEHFHPADGREPINIHPAVRARLRQILFEPELQAVGYSEFINRACEAAETQIAVVRTGHDRPERPRMSAVGTVR